MFSKKDEKLLIELSKDVRALSHKTGNLTQSVKEIYDVVYKDSDSIQNRLTLISEKIIDMSVQQKKQAEEVIKNNERIKNLEESVSKIKYQNESSEKIKGLVTTAAVSFLVPLLIGGFVVSYNGGIIANEYKENSK